MGIGSLRCVVINVTDLEVGYKFWAQVTGLEVIGSESGWHGWLGFLGTKDPWKHEIILQQIRSAPVEAGTPSHTRTNPVHIDITPTEGIDRAVEQIIKLGGTLEEASQPLPPATLARR